MAAPRGFVLEPIIFSLHANEIQYSQSLIVPFPLKVSRLFCTLRTALSAKRVSVETTNGS